MNNEVAYKKTCIYFTRWRLNSTCLYDDDLEVICIMLVDEQGNNHFADGFTISSTEDERQLKAY